MYHILFMFIVFMFVGGTESPAVERLSHTLSGVCLSACVSVFMFV